MVFFFILWYSKGYLDTLPGIYGETGDCLPSSKVARNSIRKNRIHLLDELRGFCVLLMIFYHAFYTMSMFHFHIGTQLLVFFTPAEPFFAGLFIFISGISCQLSHSNLLRGGKLLLVALALTAVTYFVIPDSLILFGILHMLSLCMLIFGAGERLWNKIPLFLGLALCITLFLITLPIRQGYIGFPGMPFWHIPASWYEFGWLFPLGIPRSDFFSSDYFPLLPWIFVFFAGTYVGRWAKNGKFPAFSYRLRFSSLSWMGRHALLLYVLHQPLIYGVCLLVSWIITR